MLQENSSTKDRVLPFGLGLSTLTAIFFISSGFSANDEIPFIPTPIEVVDRMLELAEVTQTDTIYDLGSGDGRIVIQAAKRFGARGVGIEMDSELIVSSRKRAQEEGVDHLVEFHQADALQTDVSPATVVTLYMLPWFNEKMRAVFREQLRPGARIVAHDYGIEGWPPDKTEILDKPQRTFGDAKRPHRIYLWKIR